MLPYERGSGDAESSASRGADIRNAHKFGAERLLQNLLPVLDSLEKAIETSEAADKQRMTPAGIKLCKIIYRRADQRRN